MMDFAALNWFDSFIKKLKKIGLLQPRDLHLCINWTINFGSFKGIPQCVWNCGLSINQTMGWHSLWNVTVLYVQLSKLNFMLWLASY